MSFLAGRREAAPRDLLAWAAAVPQAPAGWETDDSAAHAILETAFLGLRLDVGMRFRDLPPGVPAGELERWQAAGARLAARGLLIPTPEGFRLPAHERARTDGVVLAWQAEAERSA